MSKYYNMSELYSVWNIDFWFIWKLISIFEWYQGAEKYFQAQLKSSSAGLSSFIISKLPPPGTGQISLLPACIISAVTDSIKGRFLAAYRTDSNCHGDICPGYICPQNICPYQEYLSCYWLDLDQGLKVGSWDHL